MHPLVVFVKRHAPLFFCALTLALSFAATQLPITGEAVPVVLVFIPASVALSLTALTNGWGGVRALVSQHGQWRVRPQWLVVALLLGLALRLTVSVLALLLGLIPAIQLRPWSPAQLAVFAAMLFVFALPEELGWRGYALPRLLAHHSPLVAGLLLGTVWGALHLALTLPGLMLEGAPLLAVVLQVAGLSVLATWLYIRSRGNLLLTSVFHGAQSFFIIVNEGIPPTQQAWLLATAFVVLALLVTLGAGVSFTHRITEPSGVDTHRATANELA